MANKSYSINSSEIREKAKNISSAFDEVIDDVKSIGEDLSNVYLQGYWTGKQALEYYNSIVETFVINGFRYNKGHYLNDVKVRIVDFLNKAADDIDTLEKEIKDSQKDVG